MNLFQQLVELTSLETDGNIFYQKDLKRPSEFEKQYLALRQKEGRLYSDEVLKKLPDFHGPRELQMEWRKRRASTNRLTNYLSNRNELIILELGCGDGWLNRFLLKCWAWI